jgi:hypothetical protein
MIYVPTDIENEIGYRDMKQRENEVAAADRIEKLESALRRLLLEFDFLIEGGHLPDIRNDIIFDDARAALEQEKK